jgi:plasmid stabilization system protein ParE
MIKPLVEFHPEALVEYRETLIWYRDRSPVSAVRFDAELTKSIEKIQQAPERWAEYFGGLRRFLLHQFPFQIVYQSSDRGIFIVAIAHSHRRPGYWRNRL